jgi:hypothetical protein
MAKFKVELTISAEALFGIIQKFLPIENLHVEELIEKPRDVPPAISKIAARVGAIPISKLKRRYTPPQKRKPSIPLTLNSGINRIIMDAMADGKPHKAVELKPLLKEGGYSSNSVGSRLQNLENHGVVIRQGDGTWILGQSMKESV